MRYVEIGWKSGGRWLSVAMLGGLALSLPGSTFLQAAPAASSPRLAQTWLTFDSAHLCTGGGAPAAGATQSAVTTGVPLSLTSASPSSNGSSEGSNLLSLSIASVSLSQATQACTTAATTAAATGTSATLTVPLRSLESKTVLAAATTRTSHLTSVHIIHTKAVTKTQTRPLTSSVSTAPSQSIGYSAPAGGIGPWTPVPGHPSYSFPDFAGDPNHWEYGSCTWWAWYTRRDESQLSSLGMATNWISAARARGMSVGYSPAVGATVVFQPGVQGASGDGHVGHVVSIVGNGWFVISEMNFYWNGGGWGRVNYRYAHVGSGVAFIY